MAENTHPSSIAKIFFLSVVFFRRGAERMNDIRRISLSSSHAPVVSLRSAWKKSYEIPSLPLKNALPFATHGTAPQRAFLPLAAALQMRWDAFACAILIPALWHPWLAGPSCSYAQLADVERQQSSRAVCAALSTSALFFLLDMASGLPRPALNVEDQEDFSRPFAAVIEKQGQCDFQIRPASDGTPHLYTVPAAESRATVG